MQYGVVMFFTLYRVHLEKYKERSDFTRREKVQLSVSLFRPVRCEDVEGWRLLASVEGLMKWDGQRLAVKQLLVLNSRTPESLPHGNVLKRHCGCGQREKKRLEEVSTCRYQIRFFVKYLMCACLLAVRPEETTLMNTIIAIWFHLITIIIKTDPGIITQRVIINVAE